MKFDIGKLIFIVVCFPFCSFLPIETDLQPLFVVLIVIHLVYKYKLLINCYRDLVLLLLGLISIIYLDYFDVSNGLIADKGIGAHLSFLIATVTYLYFNKMDILKYRGTFNKVVLFYFLFSLLFIFFPEKAITIQSFFVRAINVDDENILGYRGISVFSTEPGLFAGQLIFFLLLNDYFNKRILSSVSTKYSNNYITNLILLVFMIVFSKSGTGYVYFIIYLFLQHKFFRIPVILSGVILLVVLVEMESLLQSNRGLYAFAELKNLSDLDINSGVYKRIFDFKLSFYSSIEHPLGVGVNNSHNIFKLVNINDINNFVQNSRYGFNSSFTFWIVSYGPIFVLLFFSIIFSLNRPNFVYFFFALLFLTVSYSGAYPAIWILLSLRIGQMSNDVSTHSTSIDIKSI